MATDLDSLLETTIEEAKLGLGLRRAPRVKDLKVFDVEELSERDLVELDNEGPHHSTPPISKLRTKHHRIARYMATGMDPIEISSLTGDQPSWIARLTNSPAFRNLLDHYNAQIDQTLLDLTERFHLGSDIILDRILQIVGDDDIELDIETLMKLGERLWDRAGYGPQKRIELRGAFLTTADLLKMKELSNENQRGTVVHASYERAADLEEREIPTPGSPQSGVGGALAEGEKTAPPAGEAERLEGKGSEV